MLALKILWIILACAGSFLSGSIPFAVWVSKAAKGKDPRDYNIGNPGAFNSFISFGPTIGYIIIFLDFFKGAFPLAVIDHVFSINYFVAADGSNIWHTLLVSWDQSLLFLDIIILLG